MSTNYDIYCKTCDEGMGLKNTNHRDRELHEIVQVSHLAPHLVELLDVAPFAADDWLRGSGFRIGWLADHASHKLVVRSEYGKIASFPCEQCGAEGLTYEQRVTCQSGYLTTHICERCASYVRTLLTPAKHGNGSRVRMALLALEHAALEDDTEIRNDACHIVTSKLTQILDTGIKNGSFSSAALDKLAKRLQLLHAFDHQSLRVFRMTRGPRSHYVVAATAAECAGLLEDYNDTQPELGDEWEAMSLGDTISIYVDDTGHICGVGDDNGSPVRLPAWAWVLLKKEPGHLASEE